MKSPIRKAIEGLTKPQQHVLGLIACNEDSGHPMATIKKLLLRGLIESQLVQHPGFPLTWVTHYKVPTHVHIEWCQWCSDTMPDQDELR